MPNSTSCPRCDANIPAAADRCPQCQTPVATAPFDADQTRLSEEVTVPGPTRPAIAARDSRPPSSPSSSATSGWLSTSGSIDHGRFAPGALLGGRYRIIQRLGKGGMGEVYRADDLKLGQPVALKFLPADVDRDPARLTQLHTEVRMARQVSHPNVCRVYDIDEVEGSTFLSMEYVDGEDLSSLLRRIGRFPEERALEIARQICAGLAAAHERGVVHRDLKPANIMLDSTGKVRITDFGLAGAAGESLRAGTPAYMSPEQLAGTEVTPRSDIYSLGLVLYEIFTGQRALDGKNLAELIHKREQSGIVPPSQVVTTLDPKIELAIMRCLKPSPEERPASALAVAAALPGGDPLAAALAAGETPSPEMVAAAGQTDALNPIVAAALLSFVVLVLIACAALSDRNLLYARVPMQKSLDSLQDSARDILRSLGYDVSSHDGARGLSVNFDVIRHLRDTDKSANRWAPLASRAAPVMVFWYRSSPHPLVPVGSSWKPTFSDPPMTVTGMAKIELDDTGRLLTLDVVPPRGEDAGAAARPLPWPALFEAAELDIARFQSIAPELVPRAFATDRAAWQGTRAGADDVPLRVEAAAHRGAPVSFRVTGPWEPPIPRSTPPLDQPTFWRVTANVLGTVVMFTTLLFARSNLRAGRGDRRGAWRLFCTALTALSLSWIISARHYSSLMIEDDRLFEFIPHALMSAGTIWLMYVALEPWVRRHAPGILISWTRVLGGQFVDPRVGRDLLIGAAVGVTIACFGLAFPVILQLFGLPPGQPRTSNLQLLLGASDALGALLRMIPNNLQNGLFVAVAFGIGRAISGRVWVGALLSGALLSVFILGESFSNEFLIALVFLTVFVAPLVATLLYGGLLPVVVAFLVNQAISNAPLTLQPSMPYWYASLWPMAIIAGLAAFGFYASRGGQPLFGRLLHKD